MKESAAISTLAVGFVVLSHIVIQGRGSASRKG